MKLHMLHVLHVISGNQSSVAMIFVCAFTVSTFLHILLKQLVPAIAPRRGVAQVARSGDTGCRPGGERCLGQKGHRELRYLKLFSAHVGTKPLAVPGERKEAPPRGTGGTARGFATLQFS